MQNLTEERTGRLIRELRLKAGWTQKELGAKIGISDKAISKWERGLSFPDITLLPRLAEVFHVTVGEIISGQRLSEPAMNPELLDSVVADTLVYSQRDTFSKGKRIFCLIFLTLILSAMFLCAVINLAVDHQLSWAYYPIGALTIVLALTLAVVLPKRRRLEIVMGILEVSLMIYLAMIEKLSDTSGWLLPLALPISLVSVVCLYLLLKLWLWMKRKWQILSWSMLILALGPALSIQSILSCNGIQRPMTSDWILLGSLLGAALLFHFIDRVRR
ncbi:helix-turn-helix domain-containing protein [Holdemania filiformis]|uniref:helix-turn-helix domain-containing protein n=1 Tax=Holdemania filiformis TaxID=61171 RepID=UPI002674D463|nr:helix-turn-helix domain-containing protein [Holdemania filiformis]